MKIRLSIALACPALILMQAHQVSAQIPTPRCSTYDAVRFGVPVPEGSPVSTQERAYTSPIWYTP